MVISHANHPNYFRHLERPVLSSFMAMPLSDQVGSRFKRVSARTCFSFRFSIRDRHEVRQQAMSAGWFARTAATKASCISARPESRANSQMRLGLMQSLGRRAQGLYGRIGVYYRGLDHNYRIFESRGYESLVRQWQAVIETPTQWVQLIT